MYSIYEVVPTSLTWFLAITKVYSMYASHNCHFRCCNPINMPFLGGTAVFLLGRPCLCCGGGPWHLRSSWTLCVIKGPGRSDGNLENTCRFHVCHVGMCRACMACKRWAIWKTLSIWKTWIKFIRNDEDWWILRVKDAILRLRTKF